MGGWLVAKNVVEQVSKSLEHMFDSLRTGADGLHDSLHGGYAADPSEDQISSFVRTRSTTAQVKS